MARFAFVLKQFRLDDEGLKPRRGQSMSPDPNYMRLTTMPGGEQLSERDKAALAKLRDDYAPFNAEMAAFLGRCDLPW